MTLFEIKRKTLFGGAMVFRVNYFSPRISFILISVAFYYTSNHVSMASVNVIWLDLSFCHFHGLIDKATPMLR